ncbi:MAG: TPM domain-containing protein [Thermoflavifilum aggregans]|nr:TPM domain-containing protein [Thermoflavifilum aggregans]
MRIPLPIVYFGISICCLMSISNFSLAQQVFQLPARPMPRHHVNDFASRLTQAQQDSLERLLIQCNHQHNADIVLVTMPDAGTLPPETFADSLYHFWHLGEDNGQRSMLMFVDFGLQRVILKVGDGLKGTITAQTNFMLMNHYVLPAFQRGDYYDGLHDCVAAINTILIPPSEIHRALSQTSSTRNPWWILLIAAGALLLILLYWKSTSNRPKT